MYRVDITPEALRRLHRLPEKVRAAATEMMLGALAEAPRRVGKPLLGELAGLFSARRGDYRVIYQIDEERRIVTVHRVQHRRDAYRPR